MSKLEDLLVKKYNISRSRALFLIKNKVVFVNEECITDRCFLVNDLNIIFIKIPTFDWRILWSNENLAVIYKPFGMVVEECATTSIIHSVLEIELAKFLNLTKVFPLHRIDKDTSGIILFALNENSWNYYSELMKERKFFKAYKAFYNLTDYSLKNFNYFVCKHDNLIFSYEEKCLCEQSYELCEIKINETKSGVKISENGSKVCQTLIRPISNGYECVLVSGRTHQIRLTMKFLNKIIAGDKLYGSKLQCEMQLFSYYIHINKNLVI